MGVQPLMAQGTESGAAATWPGTSQCQRGALAKKAGSFKLISPDEKKFHQWKVRFDRLAVEAVAQKPCRNTTRQLPSRRLWLHQLRRRKNERADYADWLKQQEIAADRQTLQERTRSGYGNSVLSSSCCKQTAHQKPFAVRLGFAIFYCTERSCGQPRLVYPDRGRKHLVTMLVWLEGHLNRIFLAPSDFHSEF